MRSRFTRRGVGVHHLDLEARDRLHDLALHGHAAERVDDEPSDCVGVLFMLADVEVGADDFAHLVEVGAPVGVEDAVAGMGDEGLLVVVLVLDVADDHLEDVLQRDEPVGPAVFVDDERHLDMARLHALHELGRVHGRRHEEDLPEKAEIGDRMREIDTPEIERRAHRRVGFALGVAEAERGAGDMADDVADVDHAEGIVEPLAVDGHAGMAGLLEAGHQLGQRGGGRDALDLGPGNHDVLDAHVVELEDVGQEQPLVGRETGGLRLGTGQRLGDLLAQRMGDARPQEGDERVQKTRLGDFRRAPGPATSRLCGGLRRVGLVAVLVAVGGHAHVVHPGSLL